MRADVGLQRLRRFAGGFVALMCVACPRLASAHGRPASVDAVVAARGREPWLLRLSEGLAFRAGDAWQFVCPDRFGADTITLLSAAADGQQAWIAGATDLYSMTYEGEIAAQGTPELSGTFLAALGTAGLEPEAVWGIRVAESGSGSTLLRLGSSRVEAAWADSVTWLSLAGKDSEIWLSAMTERRLDLAEISLDAQLVKRTSITLQEPAFAAKLRVAGERIFVVTDQAAGHALLELQAGEAKPWFSSDQTIDGPILTDDGTPWFAAGGELWRRDGDELEVVASDVHCVARSQTAAYACSLTRVFELGNEGPGELLFDLKMLEAPQPAPGESTISARCAAQWAVFETDLARAGLSEPVSNPSASGDSQAPTVAAGSAADAERGGAGGCSVGSRPSSWSSWLLGPLLTLGIRALRARRRRQRQRGPALPKHFPDRTFP